MEFLIDPNVAYVLLVFGFLIAILMLFAPGTGILELFAFVILAMAGYGIINLALNWWAPFIVILGFLPFVLALRRPQKTRIALLTLASLAFAIGSAFLFRGQGWQPAVNIILILVLTPIVVGMTWLIASKIFEAHHIRPTFNLDQLIGMTGYANNDIRGQGSVHVNGEDWTARSEKFIPAGSRIRVLQRSGMILDVEPVNHE